jgi:hypothetical protein
MTERRICMAGLSLFLLALLQGFFIPAFERVDAARAAHATALGSATFLIAVGMLWPKLSFGIRASARWAAALVASLYAIGIGLTVGATYPVGSEAGHRMASLSSAVLNVVGAILLVTSTIAMLWALKLARAADFEQ